MEQIHSTLLLEKSLVVAIHHWLRSQNLTFCTTKPVRINLAIWQTPSNLCLFGKMSFKVAIRPWNEILNRYMFLCHLTIINHKNLPFHHFYPWFFNESLPSPSPQKKTIAFLKQTWGIQPHNLGNFKNWPTSRNSRKKPTMSHSTPWSQPARLFTGGFVICRCRNHVIYLTEV